MNESNFLLSIVLTWTIGLIPPLFIRFVIVGRPISSNFAIGISALFWVFNFALFLILESQSKTHLALFLVAWASYWILRRSSIMPKKLTSSDVGKTGLTELMFAASEGNLRYATELLAAGDNINAQDEFGKSALMYSAMNNHKELLKLLLELGANQKLTTKANHTAEWFAKEAGHSDIVKILKKQN